MLENKSAVPHTFTKGGIFYFVRRVPAELHRHYTSPRISYSLRTRSAAVATTRAWRAALQLDEYWYHLRCRETALPGKHMLRLSGTAPGDPGEAFIPKPAVTSGCMTLSEGVRTYLRLKGAGRGKTFYRAAERACGYVIDVCGDKSLNAYTKANANAFRDVLMQKNMAGSSIVRIFGTVRSVFNFATSEEGVDTPNPFTRVYFDRDARVKVRSPFDSDAIRAVQAACYDLDDEMRWLVALVADTGMRLAEAAGLTCGDFEQTAEGEYTVRIRPYGWRRLKTASSGRTVPLVGSARWAAQRITEGRSGTDFAFPRALLHKCRVEFIS